MTTDSYIIRGGQQGFDRLKVLARIMQPSTAALLDRAGADAGMRCLDVGCGTGDVTFELARRVGSGGHVTGVDLDEVKLELARGDATAQGLGNVALRAADATELGDDEPFDLIYSRYVLTHLVDPASALASWRPLLKPGGILVVEDMDASGAVCEPPRAAFTRTMELYSRAVRARGADPDIGPKLPAMLAGAGFEQVRVHVVQPVGLARDVKSIVPLTVSNIREAVLESALATAEELDTLETELWALADDPGVLSGMPRTFQAWGRAPG